MADERSRRQKLEAVLAPNSGATDGEKANARSILSRMRAAPRPEPRFIPRPEDVQSETFDSLFRYMMDRLRTEAVRHVWEDAPKTATCNDAEHTWVVIANSILQTGSKIRRCISCGAYDPPRHQAKAAWSANDGP